MQKGRHKPESATAGSGNRVSMPFTLIELLLIVAVICILMALLMPSLGRAKEVGKRISCLGNVKQMGLMHEMYVGDNRSWLVPTQDDSTDIDHPRRWHDSLCIAGSMSLPAEKTDDMKKKLNISDKLFLCPNSQFYTGLTGGAYGSFYRWQHSSYGLKTYFIRSDGIPVTTLYGSIKITMIMSQIKNPSNRVLVNDWPCAYRWINNPPNVGEYVPGAGMRMPSILLAANPGAWTNAWRRNDFLNGRHCNAVVSLFLDGHTAAPNSDLVGNEAYNKNDNDTTRIFNLLK